jgi:hypothetical protein
MVAGDLNIVYFAIAAILIYLAARIVKKNPRNRFESALAAKSFTEHTVTERFFPAQRVPIEKNCPNCSEPLPLSALICEACDYNFLSRSVGGKHKLLPSPESTIRFITKQKFAPTELV